MKCKSVISTLGALWIIGLSPSCASQGAYVPEERATATLGGRTAASYRLPSDDDERGHVRVASYGVAKLKGEGSSKAIHLRLAVSDSGREPVTLDPAEQRLQLPDGRQLTPRYARVIGDAVAKVTVQPGTTQHVDLYFQMPEAVVPERFDVVWRVRIGEQVLSRITPFDKVDVDPAHARERAAEDIFYWQPSYYGGL
jgi:hypothetical protein